MGTTPQSILAGVAISMAVLRTIATLLALGLVVASLVDGQAVEDEDVA